MDVILIGIRQVLVWVAAGLSIGIAGRLTRRFNLGYLHDWFRFVLVFNLGLYLIDLVMTVFPGLIGLSGEQLAKVELLFHALLVRPLIFLGLLLFLRFMIGLLALQVSRIWRVLAATTAAIYLVSLAFLAVRFFATGDRKPYAVLLVLSDWLVIVGLYGAVAFMFYKTAREDEDPRRALLRNLGIIFFACQTVFIFFPVREWLLLAGFFLVLPPLLYLWHIHRLLFLGQRQLSLDEERRRGLVESYGLTPREAEIVELICQGRDNQALADELYISVHTVKHHVTAVFRKLKVENRIQLANLISNLKQRQTTDGVSGPDG